MARATGTRDLPDGQEGVLVLAALQAASLAALRDLFAVIVDMQERLV